jgi:hypothetical protein
MNDNEKDRLFEMVSRETGMSEDEIEETTSYMQKTSKIRQELTQAAKALTELGKKIIQTHQLETKLATDLCRKQDTLDRGDEEVYLKEFEELLCDWECGECHKRKSCIVQKLLPVFHFIAMKDRVVNMVACKMTGMELAESDGGLGASFEEILAEVGGDPKRIKSLLDRLMGHRVIRQLPNGRYTQYET